MFFILLANKGFLSLKLLENLGEKVEARIRHKDHDISGM
jgi:hypothetical protein